MVTRRWFLGTTLIGAGSLLLAGCGGAAAANSPAGSAAATSGATVGTLNIGQTSEPGTLDPQFLVGTPEETVVINVMDGLFSTGDKLAVVPKLAESYKQLDDLTWQFRLRQGVKFHNGEMFDATSVKASYERSMDPNLKIRNTWASDLNVSSIEIVDPNTVNFHLKSPTPHMLARMCTNHYMYPPKWLASASTEEVARKPLGTGAYVFKEWAAGDHITLEANPDFWGDPKPAIKTVTWRWTPENATRVANLKTGAWDLIATLDPSSVAEVNGDAKLQALSAPGGRRVYIGFNTKLKPVDDVRVRQALNHGTDIETICRQILGSTTTRMNSFVNTPNDSPDLHMYSYDPAKAKQLLQAAGYGSGLQLTFDVDNNLYIKGDEFPQAIVASLRDIGVNVAINKVDRNVAAQQQKDRTVHQMYLRSTAPAYDPGLDFDLLRVNHAGNATQWDDPEFQNLMK
ncbi:MAG TPA: ABC transporter substrate-binding protein, partial [Chloroflexota bacterium]